jgi:hypothetical protein
LSERSNINANLWLYTNPFKWKPLWILSKQEFQDGIRARYNMCPNALVTRCPARDCGELFTITHSDNCKKAGLIIRRHDRIKHIIAKHAENAFGAGSVAIEPSLGSLPKEAAGMIIGNKGDHARADVLVTGFLNPHSSSFFDVCILSPICSSNLNSTIENNLIAAEKRKRKGYEDRIRKQFQGDFLPFVVSSGGAWGPSAIKIMKTISNKLFGGQSEQRSDLRRIFRTDIAMSLIKSKVQGFRAPRQDVKGQFDLLRKLSP